MKVLFICTGNTCRSPMAKGIFDKITQNDESYNSDSAGIACIDNEPATSEAIEVCKEIGIDISNHKSKNITSISNLDSFDLFIVMTYEHYLMTKLLGINDNKIKVLNSGVSDPYCRGIDVYRKTRDEIKTGLESLYIELKEQESK